MSFRMSARVTATVVCCILMQILCVVSQKSFSFWGTSSSPRPPVVLYVPPNNPVISMPLLQCYNHPSEISLCCICSMQPCLPLSIQYTGFEQATNKFFYQFLYVGEMCDYGIRCALQLRQGGESRVVPSDSRCSVCVDQHRLQKHARSQLRAAW